MRILFIFIDGLGIGKFDPTINPFTDNKFKLFNNFSNYPRETDIPVGGLCKAIDATLNSPGLPQSATGQTALLTGVNAAQLLGKHLSGYPNQKLRELLEEKSLLGKFNTQGKKAAFINAYRPVYFKLGPEALIKYLSVTSVANWKAGLKFFSLEDIKAGQSIYHDFTNADLIDKGFEVPFFSAEKAGTILANTSTSYDFCLYEYFKTDKAGHAQDMERAITLLLQLELFVLTVVKNTDLKDTLIIVTSDHGNIEDLSIKTHTRNLVPLIVWGKNASRLIEQVSAIQDVGRVLLKLAFEQ